MTDPRVIVPLVLFLFGVMLGAIKWLLQRHEAHIVGAIQRLEHRMDAFEDDRTQDLERIHQIEMKILQQRSEFIRRDELGIYCMAARNGGRRVGDPLMPECPA